MAFIEGRNAVREALWAGMPLRRVLIAEGTQPDRTLDEIARLADKAGVAVSRVSKREIDKVSERGAHQGVVAEAEPYRYALAGHGARRRRGPSRTRSSSRSTTSPIRATSARSPAQPRSSAPTPCSSPRTGPRRSLRPPTRPRPERSRTSRSPRRRTSRARSRAARRPATGSRAPRSTPSRRVWEAPLEGRDRAGDGLGGRGTRPADREIVRLPRPASAGRQGRFAQRRAGDHRAGLRVAPPLYAGPRESRARADRRRLQRHPSDTALPRTRRGRSGIGAGSARVRRRRVSPTGAFRATVVFDGHSNPASNGLPHHVAGVTVVFSRYGTDADAVIESLARAARKRGEETVVVTSDAQTQWAVLGGPVSRMSSPEFAGELRAQDGEWREHSPAGSTQGASRGPQSTPTTRERLSRWARGQE